MKRKICLKNIIICFTVVIILLLVYYFEAERIYTFSLKQKIIQQVKSDESNLNMLIYKMASVDESIIVHIYSEDVQEDNSLKDIFQKFNLESIFIGVRKDEYPHDNHTYVFFTVKKQKLPWLNAIEQGFYYTDSKESAPYMGALKYVDGKEANSLGFCYQYETERIIGNLWYYEFSY